MRYGSVCSGIEAATVAWEPLGWKAAWYSEIEKFPNAVLAHHYPDTPNYGDMTKFKEWPHEPGIDLLVGGTPCQSFSVAGLRKGLDDPRGNLMLTYLAIAEKHRPKWLVWENVPGVLSSNGGKDFGTFLGSLGELGYGFAYRVLDAELLRGKCRRRRVIVVACAGGQWQCAAAVLFDKASFAPGSASNRHDRGRLPLFTTKCGGVCKDRLSQCFIDASGVRWLTPLEVERAMGFPDGYTNVPAQKMLCKSKKRVEPQDSIRTDNRAVRVDVEQAEPQVRDLRNRTNGADSQDRPRSQHRQRAGTAVPSVQYPTTRGRGRGLADVGMGLSGRTWIADGPRYRALGNSMAVPVMRWIGERIAMVEEVAS